jgi:2-dehydropantoate 2-reductase
MKTSYAIIGGGRVARHFCHYLSLLGIACQQWSRSADSLSQLLPILKNNTHILLLIRDSAIESFIQDYPVLSKRCCVHFSGSLVTSLAYGAHPLMTFGQSLYTLAEYQQVPFVLEKNEMTLATLLPGLSNPNFSIAAGQKGFYHALCVMSNNFTTILWQKFIDEMAQSFQIPKSYLMPILKRTLNNIVEDHDLALTGPLVRNDQSTIDRHLMALSDDPFCGVYQAFVTLYQERVCCEDS